jgi:hypothetical protein
MKTRGSFGLRPTFFPDPLLDRVTLDIEALKSA